MRRDPDASIALDSGYSVNYAYNSMGELHQIGWTVDGTSYTATYSFVEGSTLIAGYEISVGGTVLRTARTFESNRDLIVSVSNRWDSGPVSGFAYGNDAVGRRTSRVDGGATTNLFAYNTRSELTNALMGAAQFSWVFDSIGNRQTGVVNSTTYSYKANPLNQYTEITNGGLRSLSYDLDGNLLEDAGCSFAWDGENRLISASNGTTLVTFAYDHMSRRIEKEVSEQVGGQWSVVRSHFFLYDGWNLIQERINDHGSLSTNSYIWGLDLSGTLQGAGGIGGLLCVIQAGTLYFPVCDANGNITEYVDAAGQTVAHYEHGAFGELLASSGTKKDDFRSRFSTKYTDNETGLVYYGYRYYAPTLGRWLNRDAIGEIGSLNLFSFADNAPVMRSDALGFYSFSFPDGSCNEGCLGRRGVSDIYEFRALNRNVRLWALDFDWLLDAPSTADMQQLVESMPSAEEELRGQRKLGVALYILRTVVTRGPNALPGRIGAFPYTQYLSMFGQGSVTELARLIDALRNGTAFDYPTLVLRYKCTTCQCKETRQGKVYSWKKDSDVREYRCPAPLGDLFTSIDEMLVNSVYSGCAQQFLNDAQAELAGRKPKQTVCGER